jgi:hypothetical protein
MWALGFKNQFWRALDYLRDSPTAAQLLNTASTRSPPIEIYEEPGLGADAIGNTIDWNPYALALLNGLDKTTTPPRTGRASPALVLLHEIAHVVYDMSDADIIRKIEGPASRELNALGNHEYARKDHSVFGWTTTSPMSSIVTTGLPPWN